MEPRKVADAILNWYESKITLVSWVTEGFHRNTKNTRSGNRRIQCQNSGEKDLTKEKETKENNKFFDKREGRRDGGERANE